MEGNILRAVLPRLVHASSRASSNGSRREPRRIKQVDDKTIEFTLKKGIKWEQGYGEVTAEDVKFSFERFNTATEGEEPATYAKDWGALDHVEVTDTHSGRIILKNPAPALWVDRARRRVGLHRLARRPTRSSARR